MPRKIKPFFIVFAAVILTPVAIIAIWNESFYLDRVPMLAPIDYATPMPIRNDFRGNGDFGTKRRGNRNHQGIDILADIGTPIRAAKGGVAYACLQANGMGKYVRIQHRRGMVTIYGHLSKTCIKPCQRVRQGQVIGAVGNTGNAKSRGIAPHLHFEIRRRGVAVDPKEYLS